MMSPSSSFALVRALNCLQNSMMLICAWPSAGPTGGAGVALPAAICSFTEPVIFFAILSFPNSVVGLDRRSNSDQTIETDATSFPSIPQLLNFTIAQLRDDLFHLPELQFDRRRSPENRDHHFQRLAVFVHLVHNAREARKWTFRNAHRLVLFKLDLELGLVLRLANPINNVLYFFFR